MAYIVSRKNRFYVVTYDGIDPVTGKERRRWIPAGGARTDADAILASIDERTPNLPRATAEDPTIGEYLESTWLPKRERRVRPTTAYRYRWMIQRNIVHELGHYPLRSVRTDHLNDLYFKLGTTGGRNGTGLAPKTIYEVHMILNSAFADASRTGMTRCNPAEDAEPPRPYRLARTGPPVWTAEQLATFLAAAEGQRLYPALHLAATTGMRRGEIASLRWGDWNQTLHTLSISRTRQVLAGRSTEYPTKTRTSRRCIDLDPHTEAKLSAWKERLETDGHPTGAADSVFTNNKGHALHAESISQLFERIVKRTDIPRIRFHDLRHTHASLMVANGEAIKVVSERLGHAHPAFTMATYQHVMPGMGAGAASRFADLINR